jgi:Ala-tRNA(Pro) deacylase
MRQPQEHPGVRQFLEFLERRGLDHAVVEHAPTYSAGAEARVAAVAPAHTAKTVMLCDADGWVMAVAPASEMVDLRKVRRCMARPRLRFATEREIEAAFPTFDAGAFPPFGELFDCPEVIDSRLVAASRVLCNGGDHQHSVVLNARELWHASGARSGDLVLEDASPRVSAPAAR